jgi:hypothetical protein
MNKHSRLVVTFINIWITSWLINGLLSGVLILSLSNESGFFIFLITLIFSSIFSIPFIFITLIIVGFLLSINIDNDIFRVVLLATFFVSIAGAIFCKPLFDEFNKASTLLSVSVVVSSITVVMIFRNKLKAINNN